MFLVLSAGKLIGQSALEHGDPPTGVAFGRFQAGPDFALFRSETPPDRSGEHGFEIWTDLVVATSEGIRLEFQAVELACSTVGEELEAEVCVFGVPADLYARLFPIHFDEYFGQERKSE